jgi:hypothetical protein
VLVLIAAVRVVAVVPQHQVAVLAAQVVLKTFLQMLAFLPAVAVLGELQASLPVMVVIFKAVVVLQV